MTTYHDHLSALIAAETGALTAERVAQLSEAAETLAKVAAPPPKAKLAAVPDPIAVARTRYAELQTQPLPAGATDTQRVERANENARLLATITNFQPVDLEANGGTFHFQRPEPPEAA